MPGRKISHALDEYVSPLIGAHVRLEFLEIERYAQIMNRYAASDVMPDVFLMLSNSSYRQWKEEGKMRNLSSLLEQYGQGILNEVPEEYFGSYMEEREIYAIPCLNDRAHAFGFEYRKEIAKRYGLPMEKVKQVSDLTEIFEMLKEKNPDMIACSNLYYSDWDVMGDGLGVLMGDGQNPEIVNLYETEEYQDYYRLLYLWEEGGIFWMKISATVPSIILSVHRKFSERWQGIIRHFFPSIQWIQGRTSDLSRLPQPL